MASDRRLTSEPFAELVGIRQDGLQERHLRSGRFSNAVEQDRANDVSRV
jgi:hypothetical protein